MALHGGDFGALDCRKACNVIYSWMTGDEERIKLFSAYLEGKTEGSREVSTPVETPRNKVAQMALIAGYQTLPQEV